MKTKGVGIMSLEAKDLYIANNYSDGFNPRYVKGDNIGDYVMNRFKATLDYSLELIKLREVYEKVYRNTRFTFERNNREFTNRIINVTFKYSVKEYNKLGSNLYVKLGSNIEDLELNDCVCIINGELVAIKLYCDVETPIHNEVLGKYFEFYEGQYRLKCEPATISTVTDLRQELYSNGFVCDGIKFVRFKRSSGSARVGKCLFIDEKLYSRMHKWELCGLKIKEGDDIDLASLEAYISLTLSSIIDTLEIYPENILVVDDYESMFKERVVETSLENGRLHTKETIADISNSIWDGQSLMDISLFGNYEKKGMVLLRNQFFKSCCFNTNMQQWFKDNMITDISQLNGVTKAKNIEDVKLITTASSIKYLKFGSLDSWLNNIDTTFGVVKYEKKTHFIEGNCVQTHYQLLNTLQMSFNEVEELLKPNLDYLNMIKDDPDVLRFHIKHQGTFDENITSLESKNDIVYKLLGLNNNFAKTKMYYDFKQDLVKSFIKNLRRGHIYVLGNYSTLCGNPIEMLKMSINTFSGKSELGIGNVSSPRFDYEKVLLGCRSPHVTIGNLWLPYNVRNEDIDIYMNGTDEIIYINSIGENVLERLSGADFDSDSILLTDNQLLINAANKNYTKFLTPTNNVKSTKTKRNYTSYQKADLDIKTSTNKIGEIVNLSQELNTLIWDKLNNNDKDIMDIYYDVCQLDVMSNLEIVYQSQRIVICVKNKILNCLKAIKHY